MRAGWYAEPDSDRGSRSLLVFTPAATTALLLIRCHGVDTLMAVVVESPRGNSRELFVVLLSGLPWPEKYFFDVRALEV